MSGKKAAPRKRDAKGLFRKRADYDKAALIADWKSGKFSRRELSARYGVSKSTVDRNVRSIEGAIPGEKRDGKQADKQGMTHEERRRYVRFFNQAGMVVARAAVQRVKSKKDLSMVEMRQASEIVNGQRAGILGKQPETAIQINNNAGAAAAPAGQEGEDATTLEQFQRAREKIVGEF
jgi:hypothetical protein